MIKSGLDHIASLRDGRAVYLHGKRVDDVTRHPAYANAVKSIGRLFDFPSRHQELMTFVADSGERANRIWQLPDKLRRSCSSAARRSRPGTGCTCGFMGRSPDHVASCISGMYMGLDVFEAHDARAGRGAAPTITGTPATTTST